MDEKIYGYLVNHSIAIDKCSEAVSVCMNALRKQSKINRVQRLVNVSLVFLVMTCVKNITDLNTIVKAQKAKIDALEGSSEVEDKKCKGE